MSEKPKKTKVDLGALINLKFYRKQDNWKFCSQVYNKKNIKKPDKSKVESGKLVKSEEVLNKTYHLNSTEEVPESVLNKAFIVTDNDNSTPPNSPNVPNKDKWLPRETQSGPGESSVPPPSAPKPDELPEKRNSPSEPIFENWQDWKETQISLETLAQNWPENVWQTDVACECEDLPDMVKFGCEGAEAGWPTETQTWTNHKMFPDSIWSEDVLRELEILNAHELDPDLVTNKNSVSAEKCVTTDRLLQLMLANEDLQECGADSTEASCLCEEHFMRSAHCAPHSSELEIQLPQESLDGDALLGVSEAVSSLSECALRAVGTLYARAVRQVADELRERRRIKQIQRSRSTGHLTLPKYDVSCEEYPTRDVGMVQPTFMDAFIAGSYNNNPNTDILDSLGVKLEHVDQFYEYEECRFPDWGQILDRGEGGLDRGQMGLDRDQMRLNRGEMGIDRGQMRLYRGQMGIDRGQMGLDRDQVGLDRGQIGIDRGQMGRDRGRVGLDRGQMGLDRGQIGLDRGQMGLDRGDGNMWVPPGLSGDNNLIGRGRGRLSAVNKANVIGRGRGKI